MAVIYGKKLVQLVRIKSETVKHLYEQMHILCSCMGGSTCTESLRYWWRDEMWAEMWNMLVSHNGTVIPKICVLRDAKISVCWYCCITDNSLVSWTPFASTLCGPTLRYLCLRLCIIFPGKYFVFSVFALWWERTELKSAVSTPTGTAPFSTHKNARVEQLCRIHVF